MFCRDWCLQDLVDKVFICRAAARGSLEIVKGELLNLSECTTQLDTNNQPRMEIMQLNNRKTLQHLCLRFMPHANNNNSGRQCVNA